jgi:hypothetical protein
MLFIDIDIRSVRVGIRNLLILLLGVRRVEQGLGAVEMTSRRIVESNYLLRFGHQIIMDYVHFGKDVTTRYCSWIVLYSCCIDHTR